jgi:hypothetical protein
VDSPLSNADNKMGMFIGDNTMCGDSYTEIIEVTIDGFDIYIEPNPDQYRDGYIWSVSKDDEELKTGLVFTIDDALAEIHSFIYTSPLPLVLKHRTT